VLEMGGSREEGGKKYRTHGQQFERNQGNGDPRRKAGLRINKDRGDRGKQLRECCYYGGGMGVVKKLRLEKIGAQEKN